MANLSGPEEPISIRRNRFVLRVLPPDGTLLGGWRYVPIPIVIRRSWQEHAEKASYGALRWSLQRLVVGFTWFGWCVGVSWIQERDPKEVLERLILRR